MQKYYKPSGKFSPESTIILAFLCVLISPLFGFLQTINFFYIPFFHFFVSIGIGVGFGALIGQLFVKKGKVRNLILGYAGLFLSLSILILSHVFFSSILLSGESIWNFSHLLSVVTEKTLFIETISTYAQQSFSYFSNNTVGNGLQGIVGGIETIIICIGAVKIYSFYIFRPFCDFSETWFQIYNDDVVDDDDESDSFLDFHVIPDWKYFMEGLKKEDDTIFNDIYIAGKKSKKEGYDSIELYTSPGEESYLTIIHHSYGSNKKKLINTTLIKYLWLNPRMTKACKKMIDELGI